MARTQEEIKAYQRAYYARNRQTLRDQQAAYNEAHRQELRDKQRAFYEANKSRRQALMRAFQEANPGYRKAYNDAYYAARFSLSEPGREIAAHVRPPHRGLTRSKFRSFTLKPLAVPPKRACPMKSIT